MADFGCVDPRTLLAGGEPGAENEPEPMMTDAEFDAQAPTLDVTGSGPDASDGPDVGADASAGDAGRLMTANDGGALLVLAQQQSGLTSCTPAAVAEPEPQPEIDAGGASDAGGEAPSLPAVDASTAAESDAAAGGTSGATADETLEPSDAAALSVDGG